MMKLILLICSGFLWLLPGTLAHAQDFEFSQQEEGVLLSENGKPVFFYQRKTKSQNGAFPRANYLHPMYGLNGEILTEDFPNDHLHHRGIFWAWHQLLVNDKKVADPWECKGIDWRVKNVDMDINDGQASLEASVDWVVSVNGTEKAAIAEQTNITTYSSANNYRMMDFDIRLQALEQDVQIGGSEDAKGYSGFSARLKLPNDIRFIAAKGDVQPQETTLKAGGWMNIVGSFGEKLSGVVIMVDNSKKSDHGWILRSSSSMQNAAWPGRNTVTIEAGQTLRLKYRLLIHDGVLSESQIENIYKDFIKK